MTAVPDFTPLPSKEELEHRFSYEPSTGILSFKEAKGCRKAGSPVGWLTGKGYLCTKWEGKVFSVHRLVWKMVTGRDPEHDIDHINGVKSDNRWENLREATRSQNISNTPSRCTNALGVKGVRLLRDTGKYQVRVRGKSYGCYLTIEEAKDVSEKVYKEIDGEFSWMVRELDGQGEPVPYRPPE